MCDSEVDENALTALRECNSQMAKEKLTFGTLRGRFQLQEIACGSDSPKPVQNVSGEHCDAGTHPRLSGRKRNTDELSRPWGAWHYNQADAFIKCAKKSGHCLPTTLLDKTIRTSTEQEFSKETD
jgi:hypothetical protein